MKSISPFLWFDNNVGEAIELYSSVFPDVVVHSINRGPDGNVYSAEFDVAGQHLRALNGGPHFTFNEAISLFVECDDQAEVDRFWDALIANGGQSSQCGWLKDPFGLSWQIVPTQFLTMMSDPDPEKVQRVMAAMLTMGKLDVAGLQAAYDGGNGPSPG